MPARSSPPLNTTKQALLLSALLIAALGAHAKLSLATTSSLQFGRFAAGAGGTITIAPNGTRSRSGGVILLSSTPTAAAYTLSERNPTTVNDIVILTLPAGATLSSGTASMALSGFTSSRPPGGVLGNATQSFSVGATLHVAPNQAAGNYSGDFPITIEYQ